MMIYIFISVLTLVIITLVAWLLIWKNKKLLQLLTITKLDGLSGTDFEKIIAYVFKKHGYKTNLTPSTNDYGADVISKKRNKTVVVQTKCYYNHFVGNSAVQEIYGAKGYYHAEVACVVTNWHFSKQAITLAKELNVVLIDRKILTQILTDLRNGNQNNTVKYMYQYILR